MKNRLLLTTGLLLAACVSDSAPSSSAVELHHCAIQQTIPGAKATGAFLTIRKADDTPLSLVSAETPTVTNHVEIHEMIMANGKMKMNQIPEYPLSKGDNVFKKGSYHIMLMSMQKTLNVGEHHELILHFSDGSSKSCHAEVKSVEALTPKHMMGKMKHMHHK